MIRIATGEIAWSARARPRRTILKCRCSNPRLAAGIGYPLALRINGIPQFRRAAGRNWPRRHAV